MLQSMGSQRVGHDLATKQQQHNGITLLDSSNLHNIVNQLYFSTEMEGKCQDQENHGVSPRETTVQKEEKR